MTSPVVIPIPPDFPVAWDREGDEQRFWTQDRMHAPDAILPLDAGVWIIAYDAISKGAADYELPVNARGALFHSYLYLSVAPSAPLDQMEALGKRAQERLTEAMGRLETAWNDETLPEIKSNLAWWDAFDLAGAQMSALAAHVRETVTRVERIWHLHFRTVLPAYMAISEFDEFYRDVAGQKGTFDAYKLLQGLPNKTLEGGQALWALSRKARAASDVASALQKHEPAAIMEALGETAAGRAFRDEFRAFLQVYGQRGDTWGISHASWIEDPTAALKNLKDYVAQAELAPGSDHEALAADRERAIAAARERLKGYPKQVNEQFEFLLKAAQMGNVLSEDHGYWIDFGCFYRVRRLFLEVGRRLAAAGVTADANDVFFLTLDEAGAADEMVARGADLRSLVNTRRAELERCRKLTPAPVVGTDYGPPPDDPVNRFMTKFFGGPPPVSDRPGVLKGHAGSPGKARGTARVIASLDDAERLKPGEILVTVTTAPPWTPLFATAGAIVTDTGGILSHCAVVAREYRIPAVVGTGGATAVIKDGQLIEVDGDAGTVQVVGS